MAYAATYDGGFTRSMSRRPSAGYAVSAPATYSHGGYVEPGMEYTPSSYPVYAPQQSTAVVPLSRRLTGPSGYDDMNDYGDMPYYDDIPGRYSRPVTPHALTSHPYAQPSTMVTIPPPAMRHRRRSIASFVSPTNERDMYSQYRHGGRPGSLNIKFKRKGAFMAGIGLDEAQSHIRLSNNDAYSIHELHADPRGRILLKIKWVGYSSLTYEIPLDAYDGRVNLSTLARRVSRACVHYLQANVIPVLWDRVELHHLEEASYGVWQPMLSTR